MVFRVKKLILVIYFFFYSKVKDYRFYLIYQKFKLSTSINKRIFFVYDNNTSPCAYGDFMNMVMLANWCSVSKISTHFIVIESIDNKINWPTFSESAIRDFLLFQERCLKHFGMDNIHFEKYTWANFYLKFYNQKDKYNIAFRRQIFNKKMVVNHCFNILNLLAKKAPQKIIDLWVLNKCKLEKSNNFAKVGNYIAWNVRRTFNPSGALLANNTEDQIIKIYSKLRLIYPDYKIIILSDQIGYEYVKLIALKNDLDVLFSKEFPQNNSYLDDASVVLNSNFYFQFSGGGMSSISFFSNVNYLVLQKPGYEDKSFANGKLNWATSGQIFVPLKEYSPNIDDYFSNDYLEKFS